MELMCVGTVSAAELSSVTPEDEASDLGFVDFVLFLCKTGYVFGD